MGISIRGVAAATAAALIMAPSAAWAGTIADADMAADMFDPATGLTVAATNGDVTNIGVDYGKKVMTTTVSFTDLDVSGVNAVDLTVLIRTKTKKFFALNASADAAGSMLRYAKFVGKKHTSKKCARATLTVDTNANTMVITMPSSCLDSTKKIKMSAVSSSTDGSVTAEGSPIIALDDVFTDGFAEIDGVSDVIVRG